MSVSLEQIFSTSLDEIYRISGNYKLSGINVYIDAAEKYAASGQLIEADMYYMRDYYKLFLANLRKISMYNPFGVFPNLKAAMRETKADNSAIIIEYINKLIVDGNVNEAIRIRRSFNVTETELYDGVKLALLPNNVLKRFDNAKNFIDYAEVYNLNTPGLIISDGRNYNVLALFYLFFQNVKTDSFLIVDNYFELYNIPTSKYWFVYSLVVLYSVQNEYSDEFIRKYITEHDASFDELEKGDLIMLIFMVIVFNISDGEMLKILIRGYNSKYPNQADELILALNYCMRRVFFYVADTGTWPDFDTTYPDNIINPESLNYKIYGELLYVTQRYFGNQPRNTPIIQRLSQNNEYIDYVRNIIYSGGVGVPKGA